MWSKKYVYLIVTVVFLSLLCSCTEGGRNMNFKMSPPEKSLVDLASTTYDQKQISEIAMFSGSLYALNRQYPIECIRKCDGLYRVSYLGDGIIAVLLFDRTGNSLYGSTYSTKLFASDFDGFVRGQSLDEVRAFDPDGEYLFLYTGRIDTPRVSSHYTKDGFLVTIEYNAVNEIISINKELI